MTIPRPASDEHAPWVLTYINDAQAALEQHGLSDIKTLLAKQPGELAALLHGVTDDAARQGYAPGKWSLLESLLHTIDTERVFSYRLLRAARGDVTPLPGYEQDDWVPLSGANERSLASIITEFGAVRASTLALLEPLDENALARRTVASGHEVSARAIAWMLAGHAAHHFVLTRDRYLG